MKTMVPGGRPSTGFRFVVGAGVLFLILTVLAMVLYPGGRVGDPNSSGYAF
ncbi:MAG: hypothetical protein JOZ59_00735, partial [Candidatus Eremiobacteraeota bacterium]|nr:hypothetical protein [Candidatus Eremiobacteraeota bacterium]